MNKIISILGMAVALAVVPGTAGAQSGKETEAEPCSPEVILAVGASFLEKEVLVRGKVTHVCHTGRKCFLAGMDKDKTVQIMAGSDFDLFDGKLKNKTIEVKGRVKEHRIAKETIEKQESVVKEDMEKKDCSDMERCDHVMNRVREMKQWMADHGTDYYPIYYVQGIHYDIIETKQ